MARTPFRLSALRFATALLCHASSAAAAQTALASEAGAGARPSGWWSGASMWFLSERWYLRPLVAEPRGAAMKVMVGGYSPYRFAVDSRDNVGMDLSVGRELPLFGWSTDLRSSTHASPKLWSLGVWLPVSFHMLWDLNDPSNAIVNNDYRFGGVVKFAAGLPHGVVDQLGFRVTPFMHESSHLGDELTLAARRLYRDFERINVSYEFGEALATMAWLRDRKTSSTSNAITELRAGTDWLWNRDKGYYTGDTLETRNGRTVRRSNSKWQPILQLEHWFNDLDSQQQSRSYRLFLSTDLRYSVVYDYEKASDTADDGRTWSLNAVFGVKRHYGMNAPGAVDAYVRVYRGVNPHGQFRNQKDFWIVGLGLHLDR